MVEPESGRARDPSWAAFRRIATDPLLLTVAFMSLLTNFSSFAGVFGFIPIYADRIGASSAVLGLITMMSLGTGAVASLVAGRAAARWGDRTIIRVGAMLASLSMVVVPSAKSVALLAVTLTVNGIGNGALATMFMSLAGAQGGARAARHGHGRVPGTVRHRHAPGPTRFGLSGERC